MMSPLIKKALYFSAEKHDGQYRKGGNVPYIVHPVLIALGVREYTNEERVLVAALLHDVLEDCADVSVDMLRKEFGEDVSSLVCEVTHKHQNGGETWKEKKGTYVKKINDMSKNALLIIAVDKMCNMKAYFDAVSEGSNEAIKYFKGTPDEYRWYYNAIGDVLAEKLGAHPVVKDYQELLKLYK